MEQLKLLLRSNDVSGRQADESRLDASFDLLDKVCAARAIKPAALKGISFPTLAGYVREFLPKDGPYAGLNEKLLAESLREYLALDNHE